MAAFLSQDWLDLQQSLGADLPQRPGASARLQVVVTGGPDGEVAYQQVIEDGRLVACRSGAAEGADVTLTEPWAEAVAIAKGELDASAAFMQGRVKVVGPMGPLMAVQPVTQSTAYRAMIQELAARTEV